MKKVKSMMMLAAIAAASLTLSSCDDDPWHDRWNDPYGWYDNYDRDNWRWNDDNWNQGSQGSADNQLVLEAQTLVGEWYGKMQYSYIKDDGESRGTDEFETNMIFYQSSDKQDALSGSGVEIDYMYDSSGSLKDQQTLKFSWYIDTNGDIYLKYTNSGATFVMDAGASQYGFLLGQTSGKNYKTFDGYMIGTGSVKGDVIYFELDEVTTSANSRLSKALSATRSADAQVFGKGASQKPIAGGVKALNKRR